MEEKKIEYDFYAMGIRHAKMYIQNLRETFESIKKNFGEDAALEFSCGVATLIPTYSNLVNETELKEDVYKGRKYC